MTDEFAERGEAADLLYNIARYDEAEQAYLALYHDMRSRGPVDLYIAGKIALGLLLTRLENGQAQQAFELWTAAPSDDLGEGIMAIEHGRLSRADFMSYQVAAACLHSLSRDDVAAATEAINVRMEAVCDYARESDPALLPVALNDWKQFLIQLHGPVAGVRESRPLIEALERYGAPVALDGIDFPPPGPWKRSTS